MFEETLIENSPQVADPTALVRKKNGVCVINALLSGVNA
jgi:hypothetical protein